MSNYKTVTVRRLHALDGLRGIAALLVVAWHYLGHGPHVYPSIGIAVPFTGLGALGVQLFFLISGFVIMMSLRRGTIRNFIVSRGIRLYPIYWVSVILTFAVVSLAALPGRTVTWFEGLVNLTMIQSFFGVPHVDGVYWTLAIELAFYVQAGLLWHFGLLRGRKLTYTLITWVAIAALVGRFVPPYMSGESDLWSYSLHATFDYIPWFVLGIAALFVYEGRRDATVWIVAGTAALGIVNMELVADLGIAGILFFGIILFVLLVHPLGTTCRAAQFFGAISYVLYLIHENIGFVLLRWLADLGVHQFFSTLITVAVVVGAATVLTFWVDIPTRRHLSKRFMKRAVAINDISPLVAGKSVEPVN